MKDLSVMDASRISQLQQLIIPDMVDIIQNTIQFGDVDYSIMKKMREKVLDENLI